MAVGLVGVAPGAHPLPCPAVAGAGGQVRRVHGDASRGAGGAEEPAEQDDAQHHVPALPLAGPVPHGKWVLPCPRRLPGASCPLLATGHVSVLFGPGPVQLP